MGLPVQARVAKATLLERVHYLDAPAGSGPHALSLPEGKAVVPHVFSKISPSVGHTHTHIHTLSYVHITVAMVIATD